MKYVIFIEKMTIIIVPKSTLKKNNNTHEPICIEVIF